jgi:hypothetical protein
MTAVDLVAIATLSDKIEYHKRNLLSRTLSSPDSPCKELEIRSAAVYTKYAFLTSTDSVCERGAERGSSDPYLSENGLDTRDDPAPGEGAERDSPVVE